MSFHAPYRWRLVTLILDTEIEIHRFHRPIYQSDEDFWTAELTTPWWWERPLPDKECITSRPHTKRPATRITIKLNPDEDARLQAHGLKQEYKL